jgi:hypothetical protein
MREKGIVRVMKFFIDLGGNWNGYWDFEYFLASIEFLITSIKN